MGINPKKRGKAKKEWGLTPKRGENKSGNNVNGLRSSSKKIHQHE
jgi:hypothetical protein